MLRNRFLFSATVLAALLGMFVAPGSAEYLQQRISRGNNVGLGLMTDWCMPLITATWSGNTIQYPKGSGNLIINNGWTVGMMTANDLDGDGTAEDTASLGSGGRDTMPYRSSLEAYDVLAALFATGQNMENVAGARAGTGIDRVWTSLDPAELEEWPVEARNPHTASGTPILHGAETMFTHSGDVFNSWGAPLSGYYNGWSFYFLDFAENNSMVYVHEYFQNVTEYMKWNPTYGSAMWYAGGAAPPDGWTWKGMILFNAIRSMKFGAAPLGWCYHPEKEITGFWSKQPLVPNWTPQEPPLMGLKVLKYPELRGEQIGLLNLHTNAGGEFGFAPSNSLLAMGLSYNAIYRAVVNKYGLYAGLTNPFTGKPMTDGYPGILTPDDARYGQWIWGGAANNMNLTFWGEMHDVAPRDTFNLDWVIMFTPTGVTPLVAPPYDLANIDDPTMQEGFAPLEHYASVAQLVYDGGFVVPATPAAPPLTIIPGDREVTITWSDISLKTPDPYYSFLQEHQLDPDGVYKEYDFEGFRLYRSFVGPNDSHSEKIWESSVSGGNLSFVFVDKYKDDTPYFRMRNGMKVWYALVPYDKNYDPISGKSFSLPDPTSGKVWNRAGEAGLFNVIPRSDASNYRAASASWSFTSRGTVEATPLASVELSGNGAVLTQDPVYLEPVTKIQFTPGINEKITSDQTLYIACTALAPNGRRAGRRYITLVNSSGGVVDDPMHDLRRQFITVRGGQSNTVILQGGLSDVGTNFSLTAEFNNQRTGSSWIQMDGGGWTGGTVQINADRGDWDALADPPYTGTDNYQGLMRSGAFEITWKDGGGGFMTVEVKDRLQNKTLPFSAYIDDDNWGFMPPGVSASAYQSEFGIEQGGSSNTLKPKSERTTLLVDKIAASNTETFRLWVSGQIIGFSGSPLSMPALGVKMTLITTFGDWNGDGTVFTQYPDPVYLGDKWKVDLKASTHNDEDINLSKIKVVPNPYMASSFLDLSNTQRRIDFVNLPDRCTVRIYSLGGNLVNVLNHIGANRSGWGDYTDRDRLTQGVPKQLNGYDNHSGTEPWNLRNRFGQTVASGLYFFHVTDARGQSYTGKFYIIN